MQQRQLWAHMTGILAGIWRERKETESHLPISELLQAPLWGVKDIPTSIEETVWVTALWYLIKLPTHSVGTKGHIYNIPHPVSEEIPHALKAVGRKQSRKLNSTRLQIQGSLTGVKLLEMGLDTHTHTQSQKGNSTYTSNKLKLPSCIWETLSIKIQHREFPSGPLVSSQQAKKCNQGHTAHKWWSWVLNKVVILFWHTVTCNSMNLVILGTRTFCHMNYHEHKL